MIKRLIRLVLVFVVVALLGVGYYFASYYNLIPKRSYSAADFGIAVIESNVDYDGDGIEDFRDILLGARAYVRTKPKYDGSYHAGGYPPEGIGVCTDVIWSALDSAGYPLKILVDEDIQANVALYPRVGGRPDPNIDFRRVKNLKVFFERYAEKHSDDPMDIHDWQPGDIVIYPEHIAIVSDKRNKLGIPYIIHHGGQLIYEEDALTRYEILGHYRWMMS